MSTFTFDNIHPNTGCRRLTRPYEDLATLEIASERAILVWIAWERKQFRYVTMNVEAPASNELTQVSFINTSRSTGVDDSLNEQLDDMLIRLRRRADAIEHGFRNKHQWLAGTVDRKQQLQVTWFVETDSDEFLDAVRSVKREGQVSGLCISVPILMYCYDSVHTERRQLELRLTPLTDVSPFSGCLSLDLGNTSSTLASIRAKGDAPGEVRILTTPDVPYDCGISSRQLSESDRTVPSVIRLDKIPNLGRISADKHATVMRDGRYLRWEIGDNARPDRGDSLGLVIGPKRLLARPQRRLPGSLKIGRSSDRHPTEQLKITSSDILDGSKVQIAVENILPIELYVCRFLQVFQAITLSRPTSFALTYPTTYSRLEVDRLRDAVYHAWTRLERKVQHSPVFQPTSDTRIALVLDEASAAGFNTIERKFLRSAGGLHSFRYLYPDGFHVLLYDCGGGTTDIALVRALTVGDTLEIEVLGRSGVRDFGGDDVTVAVFKVLKYKLASRINVDPSASLPDLPNPTRSIEQFLSAMDQKKQRDKWDLVNRVVPTRFNPEGAEVSDLRHQTNTLSLWRWAEAVKHAFTAGKRQVTGAPPPGSEPLRRYLEEVKGIDKEELLDLMGGISVSRDEVDCQIAAKVDESINCCNALIRKKLYGINLDSLMQKDEIREELLATELGEPRKPVTLLPHQVDCVSVVGNGSRYALIQEKLRDGLIVPFLNDASGAKEGDEAINESVSSTVSLTSGNFDFEESQMKTAVARGAVLALFYEKSMGAQMRVSFPKEFENRLSFTVGFWSLAHRTTVRLFEEGTPYDELENAPKTIDVKELQSEPDTALSRGSRVDSLALVLQWPGSRRWQSYGSFSFSRPIEQGESVTVQYDIGHHQFKAMTSGGELVWMTFDLDESLYRSPVQRGEL